MTEATPAPPRSKSHTAGIVAAVVIVLVVVLALYLTGVLSPLVGGGNPLAQVDVTAVNWQFHGASCTGWADSSVGGFSVNGGQQHSLTLSLTNGALLGTCTAESVTTSTSGFSIAGSNTPLTVNAGSTQTLSVNVGTPSSSYSGALTISVSVATAV